MTSLVVLVILGLVWAAALLPPFLLNRRGRRPEDSIDAFRRELAVLQRSTPDDAAPRVARTGPNGATHGATVRRRRRDVFVVLLASVAITLSFAVAVGGFVWVLQVIVDVAFVGFTAMLIKVERKRAQRVVALRSLAPARRPTAERPLISGAGG